jgi:alcohol dehydrogenase class IV
VFRFTGPACPDRHLKAAEAMGADVTDAPLDDAGDILADRVIALMRETGIPNGLAGVGYSEEDLPQLVEKAHAQQRLLVNSPSPVGRTELGTLFRDAMRYW